MDVPANTGKSLATMPIHHFPHKLWNASHGPVLSAMLTRHASPKGLFAAWSVGFESKGCLLKMNRLGTAKVHGEEGNGGRLGLGCDGAVK
jgi:hypothetical protein